MTVVVLVTVVILLCLVFTYTNGFQDGSSVAASALASRAMSPLQAILLVSAFEMMGAFLGGSAVSTTIRGITSWPDRVDLLPVLASGLIAAIAWNFITRFLKLPSSSTHALVGGIVGSLYAAGGTRYIVWGSPADLVHPTGIWKVVLTLFVSPLAGVVAGFVVLCVLRFLLLSATMKVNRPLKTLQWMATGMLAFGHGANDPQKSMAIIMLSLHAAGWHASADIPPYVRLAAGLAMACGVASLAPQIVRRVGGGIYKMRVLHGLSAELASAAVVLTGSLTGGPVSASQVVSSSVMGVGSAHRIKGVHWVVAKEMFLAWFLTLPCSALFAWMLHLCAFQWLDQCLHQGVLP